MQHSFKEVGVDEFLFLRNLIQMNHMNKNDLHLHESNNPYRKIF